MTDYFGALLRSAGAVPADLAARATPTGTADLVEQEVEVEVGAAPESVAPAKGFELNSAAQSATEAAPASPEPREARRSEPVRSPFARPALDEVHPVVRAALEWVAADPEREERAASEAPEPEVASDPAPRRQLPPVASQSARTAAADVTLAAAATQPVRTVRPRQAPPLPRIDHEAEPAPDRQTAAPSPPSPVRELDFTLPRASRTRLDVIKTIDDAAPGPKDRIEVSIGTIHVRVDGPPAPRVVAQPAQAPQRPPQPERPADNSGFARSRLPRV